MTDFHRVQDYYAVFDEQNRLNKAEGKLEYEISLKLLLKDIPQGSRILDLGGGAGKYAIELAKRGYRVTLADLSEKLLSQAKAAAAEQCVSTLDRFDLVNAVDLSLYPANRFDSVILFGPLYHLLDEKERERCVSEISRVLNPAGLVFASFIPRLSGAFGIVDRMLSAPDQVDRKNLWHTFQTGQFRNNAAVGFQEGYYPHVAELENLFEKYGFEKLKVRSIRSFGHGREETILSLKQADRDLFDTIWQLIESTADDPSVIELCGHALYEGRLKK